MQKRSSNTQDPNWLAVQVLRLAAEQLGKDPFAVELGRRGGLKGGKARAEKLSPRERQIIARKAARVRWGTEKDRGTR
jgi:hypothetical protein